MRNLDFILGAMEDLRVHLNWGEMWSGFFCRGQRSWEGIWTAEERDGITTFFSGHMCGKQSKNKEEW